LLRTYDNTMEQLEWFQHIFTPRPVDPLAIAAGKGKGKVTSADPKGKRKASSPDPPLHLAPTKRSVPRSRPTGSSRRKDDTGAGPSHVSREAASQPSLHISSALDSHHTSGSSSSSTSSSDAPPEDPTPPVGDLIDHGLGTIQYIARHAYRKEFMRRGNCSGLGFLLKWVGYKLNECEPWWDVHAVLRIDPSYLSSYAIWGDGKTLFARVIKKSRIALRVDLLNKYFTALYEEHRYALAFPVLNRTRLMELLDNSNAIPPLPPAHAEITAMPYPEEGYESPGVERPYTVRNFAPLTPQQETTAPTGTHATLPAASPLRDSASPDTRALMTALVSNSPSPPHGPPATTHATVVTPTPVLAETPVAATLPAASPSRSGRIRLGVLSPSSSQALAARSTPSVLPPPPPIVQTAQQEARRGGESVRYGATAPGPSAPANPSPLHNTEAPARRDTGHHMERAPRGPQHRPRSGSPDRRPRTRSPSPSRQPTKEKDGRSRSRDNKRDSKRTKGSKRDRHQELHFRDTPSKSRTPSPERARAPPDRTGRGGKDNRDDKDGTNGKDAGRRISGGNRMDGDAHHR
jgi:hypothetical protein